jgi:methanogenic corrinoid protein MtbC1
LNYDEAQADDILSEAFALYSVEQVGEQLIRPSLVEIGERWHRAQLTVTVERFATNYTVQRLSALLRTVANPVSKPLIWVGCAPREFHEVGILLLAVYLRRAGFHVQYLGQNLYEKDLIQDVRKNRPDMLLLSASSQEGAEGLRQLALQLAQLEAPNVIVGYGGRIFNQIPELSYGIPGVFLGQSAQEAIETIGKLLYSPNVVLHMPNKPSGRASADHA